MTFELDGENPPGVLSEDETCRCALFNQCDMTSSSDGICTIIATTSCTKWITVNCNCPTQVQMIIYYLNFVMICGLGFMCVCIYFIQCSVIFPFDPLLGHDFLHVYKIIS